MNVAIKTWTAVVLKVPDQQQTM